MSAGASPTILNNVFYNVQTPIVREESRATDNATQIPLPFGTAQSFCRPNGKATEIIVGGNIYQFHETRLAFNRNGYGVQSSPTNIPNTQSDFNIIAANNDRLFENPLSGNYLPAAGSRLIDSSIDSVTERSNFNSIKSAVGIAPSQFWRQHAMPLANCVSMIRLLLRRKASVRMSSKIVVPSIALTLLVRMCGYFAQSITTRNSLTAMEPSPTSN